MYIQNKYFLDQISKYLIIWEQVKYGPLRHKHPYYLFSMFSISYYLDKLNQNVVNVMNRVSSSLSLSLHILTNNKSQYLFEHLILMHTKLIKHSVAVNLWWLVSLWSTSDGLSACHQLSVDISSLAEVVKAGSISRINEHLDDTYFHYCHTN